MRRLHGRGLDALTIVHKLVGVAWLLAAGAAVVLVLTAPAPDLIPWARLALLGRAGSIASVLTLVLGLAYHLVTVWGPFRSRWLLAKWATYLVAVGAAGYSVRAVREHAATLLTVLGAVQVIALAAAIGVGVMLERSRHHPRRREG